jgi:hypothetical protein
VLFTSFDISHSSFDSPPFYQNAPLDTFAESMKAVTITCLGMRSVAGAAIHVRFRASAAAYIMDDRNVG